MNIRKKLKIMAVAAVTTLTVLVGMTLLSQYELAKYEETGALVKDFRIEVLNLRKHEKDFIARSNWKYVDKHNKTTDGLVNDITGFIENSGHYADDFEKADAQMYKESVIAYSELFNKLALLTKEMGLDEKSGLYGEFRGAIRDVESLVKDTYKSSSYADQLSKDMLMLRRREKDFMLRLDLKYQDKFDKDYTTFMSHLDGSDLSLELKNDIQAKMAIYKTLFHKVIAKNVERGLNEKSGLMGEMRKTIHALDEIEVKLEVDAEHHLETSKTTLQFIMIFASLFFALGLLIYVLRTSKSISSGLDEIVSGIRNTDATYEFKHLIKTQRTDEFGEIANLYNHLLSNVSRHFDDINQTMASVTNGNFAARITSEVHGDFEQLTETVNQALNTMSELEGMMIAVGDGDFSARLSGEIAKPLRDLVNEAMSKTEKTLSCINVVMASLANADFNVSLGNDEVKGQWKPMQKSVNKAISELKHTFDDLNGMFEKMAQGDLTVNMPVSEKGELQKLSKNFNASVHEMRTAMQEIMVVSNTVTDGVQEISIGNDNLAQRTQETAAMVEETATAMEEMVATIRQNSDNTQQSNQLAEQTSELAVNGSAVMKKTIDNMTSIRESSNQIADIVNIIDSIAFQTNLLALNAAVEAARAGEHGRGFAVVAGEVRNLAGRSAEAANDIKKLINESVSEISKGAALSEQSGESLNQIVTSIQKMKDMVAQISSSSNEQSLTATEIGRSVMQMDNSVQQNTTQVKAVGEIVNSMVLSAEAMKQKINKFKTS